MTAQPVVPRHCATFKWEENEFHVGMTRAEALKELRDAVTECDFDPNSPATIMYLNSQMLKSDSWLLRFVSRKAVGPTARVRVVFQDDVVASLQIASQHARVYRSEQPYSTRETFECLMVGMSKDKAQAAIRQTAMPKEQFDKKGGVLLPEAAELDSNTWILRYWCRLSGSSGTVRVVFSDDELLRIQELEHLP